MRPHSETIISTAFTPDFIKEVMKRLDSAERRLAELEGRGPVSSDNPILDYLLKFFSELALPEKLDELRPYLRRLSFYLCKQQPESEVLLFDVDGEHPRFKKTEVAPLLKAIMLKLDVKYEYFYYWLTIHTNLADNTNTAKTLLSRVSPKELSDLEKLFKN